jgi:hypothetical protein
MPRWLAIFLVLIALAYAGLFLSLSSAPFTDAPNHLARAAIMKSLWFDAQSPFHETYSAKHAFMPYMLPDLGLMVVIQIFGFDLACPVWSTLTMFALVLSIWFYARQMLTTSWAIAAALACSWYLATNYLFILGFLSFQWGVAMAFIALGTLRRKAFVLYLVACFLCYGAHIACFAMLGAIVGVVGLARVFRKEQNSIRLAWELLPFAALSSYHLLVSPRPASLAGTIKLDTVGDKFGHFIEAFFVRQNYVIDRSILVLFWAIIVVVIWFGRAGFRKHWELLTTCGLAAIIYFVLPFGLGGVAYVDERALPFFFIPLLILSLSLFENAAPTKNQIAILIAACTLLAIANLGSLALFLPRQNREVAQYRQALDAIPEGKTVLPIHTRRRDGNTYPLRHAGSFYAVDRDGYVPYLFSQTNASGPSGYFYDLSTIYRPPQGWYTGRAEPDWAKVKRTYDYLAITKPWNPKRIDLSRLELYYENPSATVFRVRK